MDNIQILGIIIVGGVFGLGFLGLGVYMFFDKTPRNYIPKPPPSIRKPKK
jgi:hypothetical protein